MPKSSTLMQSEPSGRRVQKRFAGLRSRCTMPSECASAIASHACRTNSTASPTGSGPRLRGARPRGPCPRGTPSPCTAPRCRASRRRSRARRARSGSCAAARASRAKRATASGFLRASAGSRNLIATLRVELQVVAATTTPIAPAPRTRSTRYLPARTSPSRTPSVSWGPLLCTTPCLAGSGERSGAPEASAPHPIPHVIPDPSKRQAEGAKTPILLLGSDVHASLIRRPSFCALDVHASQVGRPCFMCWRSILPRCDVHASCVGGPSFRAWTSMLHILAVHPSEV